MGCNGKLGSIGFSRFGKNTIQPKVVQEIYQDRNVSKMVVADIVHGVVLESGDVECVVLWFYKESSNERETIAKEFLTLGHVGKEREKELHEKMVLKTQESMRCIICDEYHQGMVWRKRPNKRGLWFCKEHENHILFG